VGHTDDLELRLAQHSSGQFGGYTSRRLPVQLLWSQTFESRDEAWRAEQQIKGWRRAKKEAVIRGDYGALPALSKKPKKTARPE
jgi:predicted GIY-YIG superfamily endonuclease